MRMRKLLFTLCLLFPLNAYSVCVSEGCGLVIRGKVSDIETVAADKRQVVFKIKLDVKFANEGDRPIILFNPDNESRYWLGGWALYEAEAESGTAQPVFVDGYWQSVSGGEFYQNLADRLDVKTPPADLTRILKRNEKWAFSDEFQIQFETEKNHRFPVHRTWKEMQELGSAFRLRISYELSPWNVEYFKPNLIRKLSKRWFRFGEVLIEKRKEGRFNHFTYSSESMGIDFSKARRKD